MRMTFSMVSTALWGALAASVTVSILSEFSWPTAGLIVFIIAVLGYWLAKHRSELHAKYEKAEETAAIPGPYDKQIWRCKPKVRDVAPGLAILGISTFYFAYTAAHGDPPTKIARLVYQLFGVPGVVGFWSLLGVVILSKTTEIIIGSRVRK